MAKRSVVVDMTSYGIYSTWDSKSKALPKIQEFTTTVDAEIDVEFGYILNIKKAKGEKIRYCIYHRTSPPTKAKYLNRSMAEEYVGNNDWDFYLGDTIWAPVSNKLGKWRMTVELKGNIIADKTFDLVAKDEGQFWKRRGF